MNNKALIELNENFIKFLKTQKTPEWASIYLKKAYGGFRSYLTNRPYSLGNAIGILLNGVAEGHFATYKQIEALGGQVNSVAVSGHGSNICYWGHSTKKVKNDDGTDDVESHLIFKHYVVFNVETQATGITNKWHKDDKPAKPENMPIPAVDAIIADYCTREKLQLEHANQGVAFYAPSRDAVNLPNIENISSVAEYYSAAFHELGHSTGAEKRLNRKENKKISRSANYAREELVAEFCAILCMNYINLATDETRENSFAYLKSFAKKAFVKWDKDGKKIYSEPTIEAWEAALTEDPYLLYGSLERAEKAFKMIFNIHDEPVKE